MVTRAIPHEEWIEFLEELSETEDSRIVSIEEIGLDTGDQIVVQRSALQGLTLVEKGSDAGEIEIMMGDAMDNHVSHVVVQPAKLSILEDEDGTPNTLHIESVDGLVTMMRFLEDDVSLDEDEDEIEIE